MFFIHVIKEHIYIYISNLVYGFVFASVQFHTIAVCPLEKLMCMPVVVATTYSGVPAGETDVHAFCCGDYI